MAKEARKRGNLALRERPDSPEWSYDTQKTTCVRTFEGLYADLLAQAPRVGTPMAGYSTDLLVENVKLKKAVSGKTTMTVTLEISVDAEDRTYPEPVQPVFEIEWTQLERPIEQHNKFKALFPDPKGQTDFSDDQITALNNFYAWDNTTDVASRKSAYTALTDDFKKLAQKKMRGTTTFLLFAPVARITTLARNVTAASQCGVVFGNVPAFNDLPDNYEWLLTADRSTRTGTNGKWQRIIEWTGADVWDSDIYPDDASNTSEGG